MQDIRNKLKIRFEDSFFEDEIRCDYLVTQKTKKIWAIQIDLLAELLRICNEHDIKVSAFAGTILGAIRHKGYIPWDDDIDVCMDRENFNRLLLFSNEFKHPYFLQTAYNDKEFFIGYARLRNTLTTGVVSWEKSEKYNGGIFIDIFVLDGFVSDSDLLSKQLKERRSCERKLNFYHWKRESGIKKYVKALCKLMYYSTRNYEYYINKYNSCISAYTDITDRITLMTHDYRLLTKYWCHKDDLLELIYVPFENINIPIPKKYDEILRNMYGNYMEFPPIEKRGKWHENIIIFDPDTPYKEYFKKLYENEENGK